MSTRNPHVFPPWCGVLIAIALVSPSSSIELMAADWPQWRGPDRSGEWRGIRLPTRFTPDTVLRLWRVSIGGGYSGISVADGRVFTMDKSADGERVLCFAAETGKLLWNRTVREGMPHQGHHNKGGFASASPVTDGEHIYAYFGSFGLFCYDFEGRFVWKKDFEPQAMEDSLGEGSSPALYGNKLVIVVDQELQSYVVAIDKETGKDIWKQDREEPSNWSTPRIFSHAGRRQVVVNGKVVRTYDLATGELLWRCGGHTASAIPMPAIGHGLAFTASGWRKDTLQAIRLGLRGDLTGSENVICPSLSFCSSSLSLPSCDDPKV